MRNPDTATHTIEWDEDCEAVIHAWTAFTAGEDFREGANALVAHLRKPGVSKLIVDASGIQTHDDEDRGVAPGGPGARDGGARHRLRRHGHADGLVSEMEMEEMSRAFEDIGYARYVTGELADARQWIAGQP